MASRDAGNDLVKRVNVYPLSIIISVALAGLGAIGVFVVKALIKGAEATVFLLICLGHTLPDCRQLP